MSSDRLRIMGIEKGSVFTGPKSMNLHITDICNLNCAYCWFHSPESGQRKLRGHIPFPKFTKVVDDICSIGVESLTFSGEGEPTLHPDIGKMITYAKSRGLRLNMLTNGTFSKETLKHVMKLDSMTVNLATLSSNKYSKIQSSNPEAAGKAMKNMELISGMKRKLDRRMPAVNIGFIINELNYQEVYDIFAFARKHGLNVRFRLMKANDSNEKLILSHESAGKLGAMLEGIMKEDSGITNSVDVLTKLAEPNFLNKESVYYDWEKRDRIFYFDNFSKDARCFMGWYFSHIDMDGNIRFCCQNPFLKAGNLEDTTFKEAWNSEAYMKLRMECKSGIDTNKKRWMECRHCPFAGENKAIDNMIMGDKSEGKGQAEDFGGGE